MQTVVLLCQRRGQQAVLELLEEWQQQASIVLYGVTAKGHDGYVITHWTPAVPDVFHQQYLDADPRIHDYIVYDVPTVHPQEQNRTM